MERRFDKPPSRGVPAGRGRLVAQELTGPDGKGDSFLTAGGLARPATLAIFSAVSATPLSSAEIETALATLPGWKFAGDALAKEFKFDGFRSALSFMLRVGFEAEAMDHHPDWTNVYHRVSIRLNTHDAGGKVTAKDVELARRIQSVSWVG